ncbi:uncharacterized protein METZ01_LOCUS490779, partial [marine metagenome]
MGNLQAHATNQVMMEELHTALTIISNREQGAEPNVDHVERLCAMGEAGRLSQTASLAATALAQHLLLRDERNLAERL